MTMSPTARARVLGSLLVALAFVAGIVTGMAIGARPRPGLNVMVTATATTEMPRELDRLGLTRDQEAQIRPILVRGRNRVFAVVRAFGPPMKMAMDSTDAEIDAVLTPTQRASLAAYRKEHPPFMDQRVIRKGTH